MHLFRSRSNILRPALTARAAFCALAILAVLAAPLALTSCRESVQPTTISVKDSVRHYYPVIRGDEVKLSYEITNTGDNTLVITDIMPSCRAIILTSTGDDEDNNDTKGRVYKREKDLLPGDNSTSPWEYTDRAIIIPPGRTDRLTFIYRSDMNMGYVSHDIRIYGNIVPDGVAILTFDLHIVRPTPDHSDYEEIYYDHQSAIDELIDGKKGEKGYYTDAMMKK